MPAPPNFDANKRAAHLLGALEEIGEHIAAKPSLIEEMKAVVVGLGVDPDLVGQWLASFPSPVPDDHPLWRNGYKRRWLGTPIISAHGPKPSALNDSGANGKPTSHSPSFRKPRMDPAALRALIRSREFGVRPRPERPDDILFIGGTSVATPGNIIVLAAQAGSMKTHVLAATLAALIVAENSVLQSDIDTLGITAGSSPKLAIGVRRVLHFDTEQSPHHHHRLIDCILKRAKVATKPGWFRSISLVGLTPSEMREVVRQVVSEEMASGHGVLALVIDGVADLIADPNDLEQSTEIIAELQAYATQCDGIVITVMHENAGQEAGTKMRGHLGSQADRKAETVLRLKRDKQDGPTILFTSKTRGKPIKESQGVGLAWNEAEGMPMTVYEEATAAADYITEQTELTALAVHCLSDGSLRSDPLNAKIRQREQVSESTAKNRIKRMAAFNLIEKQGKSWRLVVAAQPTQQPANP